MALIETLEDLEDACRQIGRSINISYRVTRHPQFAVHIGTSSKGAYQGVGHTISEALENAWIALERNELTKIGRGPHVADS